MDTLISLAKELVDIDVGEEERKSFKAFANCLVQMTATSHIVVIICARKRLINHHSHDLCFLSLICLVIEMMRMKKRMTPLHLFVIYSSYFELVVKPNVCKQGHSLSLTSVQKRFKHLIREVGLMQIRYELWPVFLIRTIAQIDDSTLTL